MKFNKLKAGILIATLGVPALVFIFFKIFGSNNFDLPRYFPVIADNGEVKMSKGDTVFNQIPQFTLLNEEGKQSIIGRGDIKVVSFFFSRCGTICPTTNANIKRVAELIPNNTDLKFYSISIDPKYDTPGVLKAYRFSQKFNATNWSFLTGDKKYIYDLAIKNFKLPVADASEYDKGISNIDETFIHSDKLLLIDKQGYCRGIYGGTDKFEIDRLILEIKVLLSQK
jgi:protein SCO1